MLASRVISASFLLLLNILLVDGQIDSQVPFNEGADTDCHAACTSLLNTLSASVHYDGSTLPPGFLESLYTSQQRAVIPACILTPTSATEVSEAIRVIGQHNCPFAVKSGGHALSAGASNADGGITIDLKLLNRIDVLDEETTRVGTGNKWATVYEYLEPLGKSVVGGRNGAVGVGGFILGGGISFLSRRYGWACDNVRNFELVLSNGSIANINSASAPDLYRALRGGGSNFGIVTSFDVETYPQGPVWGGASFYLLDPSSIQPVLSDVAASTPVSYLSKFKALSLKTVIGLICRLGYCVDRKSLSQAFNQALIDGEDDPYAQIIFALAWTMEAYLSVTTLVHTKPDSKSAAFKPFTDLQSVYNTNKIQNLTTIYEQVMGMNEPGNRQLWGAVAFKIDDSVIDDIIKIWIEEMEPLKYVKDAIPSIVFQGIYKEEIALFAKNGGNAIGIDSSEGPLILFSLAFSYSLASSDALVNAVGNAIYSRIHTLTTSRNLHHRFIYQNYANASQDVFAGYGVGRREELREVQRRWDVGGVWRRLRTGYFVV